MSVRPDIRTQSPFQAVDRANKTEFSFKLRQDNTASETSRRGNRCESTLNELVYKQNQSLSTPIAKVITIPVEKPKSNSQSVIKTSFNMHIKLFVTATACGFGVLTRHRTLN